MRFKNSVTIAEVITATPIGATQQRKIRFAKGLCLYHPKNTNELPKELTIQKGTLNIRTRIKPIPVPGLLSPG